VIVIILISSRDSKKEAIDGVEVAKSVKFATAAAIAS
jgi:hypothetical protein